MNRLGVLAYVTVLSGLVAARPALATVADPAGIQVEALCNGFLDAVKHTTAGAGISARARHIQPLVDEHFNVNVMAQFAVGPAWSKMTPAEHLSVETALGRYTGARIAQEFDEYTGQRCVVDPAVQTRGPDKLVKSQIMDKGESSQVNYRLRQYGSVWKVIDVYYRGVSQISTERADFASVLQSAGAGGLAAKLNELTIKMR